MRFSFFTTQANPAAETQAGYVPMGSLASFSAPAQRKPSLSTFLNRRNAKRILLIVALLLLMAAIPFIIRASNARRAAAPTAGNTKGVANVMIGKSYTFNARNDQAKIVDKRPVKLTFTNAELSKSILIKGQPATARDGKAFLIVNIDLENQYQERYYLPVNDLVRLVESDKLRAPDVHNNLVLIDPISTKSTRIGFLIDDGTKQFTLRIGELNGEKQNIDIKF